MIESFLKHRWPLLALIPGLLLLMSARVCRRPLFLRRRRKYGSLQLSEVFTANAVQRADCAPGTATVGRLAPPGERLGRAVGGIACP